MSRIEEIQVADLQLDLKNPRLTEACRNQRDALHSIAKKQGSRLRVLANDILQNGNNPSDLPIVVPSEDDPDQYDVLDGNRRLATLRALEDPTRLPDDTSPTILSAIKRMSDEYLQAPIESLNCAVFDDRSEATHWIELRHTGEQRGAGAVRWGSDEMNRFRQNVLGLTPNLATQALDFLEHRGQVTAEQRTVSPTTLDRILGSPAARARMGLYLSSGTLHAIADGEEVSKALLHVVNSIHDGRINVNDVRSAEQREDFARNLPDEVAVTPTVDLEEAKALRDLPVQQPPKPTRRHQPRLRPNLIPRDCFLYVTAPRIEAIALELQRLPLSTAPNAVGVLLRVFIELSLDDYIARKGLEVAESSRLRKKLLDVVKDLVDKGAITGRQATPVRRAASKDSFLNPSIDLQHSWVHNQNVTPVGSELRSHWDDLQPFVQALWPEN